MIPAHLVRQAVKLLDAVPGSINNPVYEVNFRDSYKVIEVWNMLADEENIAATATYDEP